MTKKAASLVPQARIVLEGRNFTKAKKLARMLGVTPQLAGQCLAAMDEWDIWNRETRAKRTWARRAA